MLFINGCDIAAESYNEGAAGLWGRAAAGDPGTYHRLSSRLILRQGLIWGVQGSFVGCGGLFCGVGGCFPSSGYIAIFRKLYIYDCQKKNETWFKCDMQYCKMLQWVVV